MVRQQGAAARTLRRMSQPTHKKLPGAGMPDGRTADFAGTAPKTTDSVVPQPTPENTQPVENGGSAGAASEVVVTTMPGSGEPTPGNPVPPATATSELSSTNYGTQNGTTAEVLDENATARADAATATAGSLADCAHDLRTIRRVRVDIMLIGNGHRACNPEQVRMITDSMAQVGLINPITVITS
jgi:hypothetical protein